MNNSRASNASDGSGTHFHGQSGLTINMEGLKPEKDSLTCRSFCQRPTKQTIFNIFPIIEAVKTYDVKTNLVGDIVAGITVGVMLIPQGMAYALLAGLPPQYGLYSSVLPIIMYAFFGTSRQLAVGPVAIVSLLVFEAMEGQGIHDEEEKIHFAILLAFFAGVLSAILGIVRAGLVSSFLSHSVLIGFTAGAAIVIGLSQLKGILGFSIQSTDFPIMTIVYALRDIAKTEPAPVTMGILSIIYMLFMKYAKQWWTKPLVYDPASGPSETSIKIQNGFRKFFFFFSSLAALEVVIMGTLVSQALYTNKGYTKQDLAIVGSVPAGFPAPRAPDFSMLSTFSFGNLFVSALVITILGFMESFAVADRYARKLKYSVDANKELFALGVANIIGSFFNSYSVTGGFSRTAVNEGAGATTVLASILSALIVLIVIVSLTSSFYYMPKAVLSAIVLVAVSSLFDFHAIALTWKVSRKDFWVIITTFLATVCLGTEIGLAVGFGFSVLMLLQQVAFPHTAQLGLVENSNELYYRNVLRFPEAKTIPNVLMFRLDASFNFANKNSVLKRLFAAIDKKNFDEEGAQYRPGVILSCEGINSMDVSGLEALMEVQGLLHFRGISFIAAAVKGPVRDVIQDQNTYLARHSLPLLLPWAHKVDASDRKYPISMMVASMDEALDLLSLQDDHIPGKAVALSADTASTDNDSQNPKHSLMSVV